MSSGNRREKYNNITCNKNDYFNKLRFRTIMISHFKLAVMYFIDMYKLITIMNEQFIR